MARDVCRDLGGDSFSGNYYDLASVHSDNEQAFLSAIFAEHDPGSENFWEFWIGYRYVPYLYISSGGKMDKYPKSDFRVPEIN